MRLTLRTLLAWLDDTLSPSEVREIGRQVSESSVAKELVDRIHRVTRQRRLTVPPWNGPDGADPNLVAAYLDNELDPERVAEFEKKCLTSDVHLAEVASAHQILSLIGQKAKVPNEARNRMYMLIKGRESVAPKIRNGSKPERMPITEPIQPWVAPEPPSRPWYERYLPAAVAVALLIVLIWSAWMSLSPPETSREELARTFSLPTTKPTVAPGEVANTSKGPAAVREESKAPAPVAEEERKFVEGKTPKAAPEKALASTAGTESSKKAEVPALDLPPGVVGVVEAVHGILLRYNSESRQWERLQPKAMLKSQDRVLSLAPFRSTLDLGRSRVDLVGETEVWVLPTLPNLAGRINLQQGRVILHGKEPAAAYEVQVTGRTVSVTPPSGAVVGLERLNRRDPGPPPAWSAILRVYAPEGEVALSTERSKESLRGPAAITSEPPNRWTDRASGAVPSWVTESSPPPFDAQVGELFAKRIKPDRPIISELAEAASDDESRDIRRLAISALRATGEISEVVTLLGSNDAASRRASIVVLRSYLGQGAESARKLQEEVVNIYGKEAAPRVQKLLSSFTPKEAKDEATYKALVDDLSSNELAIRELALDNLQSLTGRDDLGYDPAKPNEGKGLKAWKDLLHGHELHPAGIIPEEDVPPPPPQEEPAAKKAEPSTSKKAESTPPKKKEATPKTKDRTTKKKG